MPLFLIPIILQLISSLPQLIQIAEQAFGGAPGNGPAKKQLVLAGASTLMNVIGQVQGKPIDPSHQTAILGGLSSLADAAVAAFNLAGIFKKG